MKKTPQDLTLFKGLSQTETGKYLVDYLKRVVDHVHDSRSWKDGDTKESAAHAARLIEELVMEHIHPRQSDSTQVHQFE